MLLLYCLNSKSEVHKENCGLTIFPILARGGVGDSIPFMLSGTQFADIRNDYTKGVDDIIVAIFNHLNILFKTKDDGRQSDVGDLTINGRTVVSQTQAARYLSKKYNLSIKQYQISRWIKAGRFETATVDGHSHSMIYKDSLHIPTQSSKGKKKLNDNKSN